MKQNIEPRIAARSALGSVAFLGAFLSSPASLAQTASEAALPKNYIGEYLDALDPRLDSREGRHARYEHPYERIDVDEDLERGLGHSVERGIELGFGIDLPDRWRWRVTDDAVRGTGMRLEVRIPLNPTERR